MKTPNMKTSHMQTSIIKRLTSFAFLSLTMTMSMVISTNAYADKTFGIGADMSKLTPISQVLDKAQNYYQSPVTIEGMVVKVCKKRGCWMELASDKAYQSLTIKVPDGQMVFPMSAMGKTAYATGNLTPLTLNKEKSIAFLKKQAKQNNQKFDESKMTELVTLHRLTPIGVTIKD